MVFFAILKLLIVISSVLIASVLKSGWYDPPLCEFSFRLIGCPEPKIGGINVNQFPKAFAKFKESMSKGNLGDVQFSAFKNGKEIFNIFGSYNSENPNYNEKTIQIQHSNSKVISPIIIAMMIDRGFLDLHKPISNYWPEFGKNGKANITVAQLMRHEARLQRFDQQYDYKPFLAGKMESNWSSIIENSHQKNFSRYYHGYTRGLIENELVKRVDPKHRNVNQIWKEEIADVFDIDCWFGLPENQRHRYVDPVQPDMFRLIVRILIPYFLGFLDQRIATAIDFATAPHVKENELWSNWDNIQAGDTTKPKPQVFEIVSPSSHSFCTASGMAKAVSILANHGTLNGKRVFSEKTFDQMISITNGGKIDKYFQHFARFTDGGWVENQPFHGTNTWEYDTYGWAGWGGHFAEFSPSQNFSMAFLRASHGMHMNDEPYVTEWFKVFGEEYEAQYGNNK